MATVKETAQKHHKAVRTVQEAAQQRRIPAEKRRDHHWFISTFQQWPERGRRAKSETEVATRRYQEREYGGGKTAEYKRAQRQTIRSIKKPALVGSEKQVAYAEKIRAAYGRVAEHERQGALERKHPGAATQVYERAKTDMQHRSSVWWIENRAQVLREDAYLAKAGKLPGTNVARVFIKGNT